MINRFSTRLVVGLLTLFPLAASAQNIIVTISGPTTICGDCITLTATVTDSQQPSQTVEGFNWLLNGTLIATNSKQIVVCEPGNYTVIALLANSGSVEDTHSVTLLQYQPVTIVSSNPAACNPDSTTGNPDLNFCEKVCPNSTVTYSIQNGPVIGGTASQISWVVTGALSYTVNPPFSQSVTVNWGSPGTGSVVVKTFSSSNPGGNNGCPGEDNLCVTIVEEPRAKFQTTPATPAPGPLQICKGQTVFFDNQSQFADTYEWLFSDDASTASDFNPQHTYFNPGSYIVRLIARSACLCADTTETTVEVLNAESPALECVGDVCPGASVTYKASANCSNIAWTISANGTTLNGGSPGADSITVQWNAGPAGVLTLNGFTCTGQTCPQPTVVRIPVIDDNAEIRGAETVCPDAEEVYSIEPFGGTAFSWTLGSGGTITQGQGSSSVTVHWNSTANPNTTHWLSVVYDNCYLGCGGRDSIPVRIVSPFVVSGPVETCENTSRNFSSRLTTNGQNLLCNWTLEKSDGTVVWTSPGASAAPTVPFSNGPGLYRLFAVPANPALSCTDRGEWAINVPALPAGPSGIDGPALVCPGQLYTYTAAGLPADANLQWSVQNGPGAPSVSTGNPLNVNWGAIGPYQLTATRTSDDGLGCASLPVQLAPLPLSSLTLTGPDQFCANSKAAYSVPQIPGMSYQWSLQPADAGTVIQGQGTNAVEVFWQTPGNRTLSVSMCGQTASLAVTINALPTPAVNHPAEVCAGGTGLVQTSAPFATYTWLTSAGATLATTSTTDLGPGNYSLSVTDSNGCAGTANFSINTAPAPNLSLSTADPTAFCNNSQTVTMQALTNAGGSLTYEWFQNGAPLGVNAPVYSTNQYGTYTVQATTVAGCTATAGPVLIVQDCGPGGGGGGFPGSGPGCPPGSLNLQIDPSGRCDSFAFQVSGATYIAGSAQWIFGQSGGAVTGSVSGDQAQFTFPNAGHYIVALVAQLSSGGVCRLVDSVVVEAVAKFDALPACPGTASGFKENSAFMPSSGITAWTWNFGDPASGAANTGSGQNPSHTYATSGAYPVTLTVTANSGCTSSFAQPANIPQPVPPVFAAPAVSCAGNALTFNATGADIGWNFGDPASGALNTASGPTAYHTFAAGTYTVTATATDALGCTATATQTVTIAPNTLGGTITPGTPAPICEGGSLTLTAPAGGAGYLWSENAASGTTLVVSEEGVYSVTLTDANGCTFVPPPVKVEVKPGPDAVIKALLMNELGQIIGTSYPAFATCAGEDVRLIAQGAGVYTYSWSTTNTGAGIEFTDARGNLLTVGPHTYTVTVTDITTGCTAATDPFLVTVNPVPSGFSIANGIFPACADAVNTLSYTGPNPGNWQFIWNTGQTDLPLVTTNPGKYFLRVINEFGCEARSNPVTILPGPQVSALPAGCHTRCKPDTLCIPPLPNISAWQWYFNGSAVPGATGPNFVPQQSGTYYAVLTDFAGCTNQSDPLTLNLLDGYGNILGQVWDDVNNNGLIDAPDTLVSGIPVNLLQGGAAAGSTQSGAGGNFAFANVLSTNYLVKIDSAQLPPGWTIVIGQQAAALSGCNAQTQVGLLLRAACLTTLFSNVLLTACPGDSVSYNGTLLAAGTEQNFNFTSTAGCDSVVTVMVYSLPTSAGVLNVKACVGTNYNYNGTPIPAGTSKQFLLQNFVGCDSVLTVNVGVLATSAGTLEVKVCPGTSYNYSGTSIPAGTSQQFVLQNSAGCDSVLTVNVGTLPTSAGTLEVKVCPGTSYMYSGTSIPAGSSQQFVLQNSAGCDSVLTVNVGTLPTSTGTLAVKVCPGTSYTYSGTSIPAGSSQQFVLQNSAGCDSVLTVNVGTLSTSTGTLAVKVCPGTSYTYSGTSIPAGSSQQFVLQNSAGCDSVLTVNVGTLSTSTGTLNVKVCPGTSYTYSGTSIPAGSSQQFVLQNSAGCDSVLTVNVGTLPTSTSSLNVKVCPGTSYNYSGTSIPAGTSQQFVLQNSVGCDSVLTVNVGTLPTSTGTLAVKVCPGTSYTYSGTSIPAGSSQQFVLQNSLGCDSVLTVNVGTLPTSTGTLAVNVCPGTNYTYNGTSIPAGTSQQFVLQNSLGCDSVLTVNVGTLPTSTGTLNARVCPGESFIYNGNALQIGQSQVFTLQNALGCDSFLTVSVSALPTSSEPLAVTICPNETYSYAGEILKPGETRIFHFTNSEGCDSSVVVMVAAFPTATFSLEALPSCAGTGTGSLRVLNPGGGLPPYRYSLDGTAFQDELIFKDLSPGTYSVWLEDSNGCLFRQDKDLPALLPLSLSLEDGVLSCDTSGTLLNPVVGGDTTGLQYLWSTGAQTPTLTVYDPGPLWLEIRNVCETLHRDVQVNWANVDPGFSFAYVPNVFAPLSNDPDNSRFRPYLAPELEVVDYRFEVFDRWGNLMFRSFNPGEGWTGPFRQEDMQPAVFVWYFLADVLYCGRVRHLEWKRDVTIVR